MTDTITGYAHLDKIADEIGDDAGTCDADYAFQRSAALMIYNLRNALEAAEAVLLKEEVYSEELESQLQHAREENDRLRAERDWLAAKMADISDKMNRPDAPTFCAACNICPIGDEEMEGRTCLVAIEEAARRAVAESEVRE